MKISKIGKCFVFGTAAVVGICVLAGTMGNESFLTRALGSEIETTYTLKLTSSNAPTASDMSHHTIYTGLGNPIDVTYTNCEVSSGKHVKINAGGEIVLNRELLGVYSGNASYTGTLKVWLGLSPDQMWEADISSSVGNFFSTYKFNYVKLVAVTDVELESVNLNYSCADVGSQKASFANVDVAPGTIANFANVQTEIGSNVYFGAKGLGNNAVTVKVNGKEVEKASSGAYEFPMGPADSISVESDYDVEDGVVVNCYNVDGSLIETKTVEFTTYDEYSGTIYAPVQEGYVANTPVRKVLLDKAHQTVDIYYSELSDEWDGTTASASFSGEGTEASPYLIESGADLKLLSDSVNGGQKYTGKFFRMTKSIDLGDHGLVAIGSSSTIGLDGTFDGNNCAINGLKAANGLFGYLLAHGEIKNLSLDGVVNNTAGNTVTTSSPFVLNSIAGSKITNCFNFADLNITSSANPSTGRHGGILGLGNSVISGCENYGDILNKTGKRYYTGGIVGSPSGTMTIQNTINWGIVSGGTGTGGIAGCQAGNNILTIENCQNFGEIQSLYTTANYISGGIVGATAAGSELFIQNAQNYGHVIGTNYSVSVRATQFGGILGNTFNTTKTVNIKSCDNYGEVEADYVVGGICGGSTANSTVVLIDGCNNYGYVHANGHSAKNTLGYVGGIAGWARSATSDTITNCVNWGEVEAKYAEVTIGTDTAKGGSGASGILSYTGGATHVTVEACVNFGYVHVASDQAGGIMAGTTSAAANLTMEINDCVNYGTIQGTNIVGGIIGIIYVGTYPQNCVNHGVLIGKTNVGDIAGKNSLK